MWHINIQKSRIAKTVFDILLFLFPTLFAIVSEVQKSRNVATDFTLFNKNSCFA